MTKNIIAAYILGNDSGIAIFDIVHGIDNYVVAALIYGEKQSKMTKNKVYYNQKGESYFIKYRKRYYLNNFMRV